MPFTTKSAVARTGLFLLLLLGATLMPSVTSAQPVLAASPTSFSLQGAVGTNLASQAVQVSNAGNRALKWSVVTPTVNWLAVSPTSGVNSGTITLTFRTSPLTAGTYQASFKVQSSTGSSIQVAVQVSMVSSTTSVAKLTVSCPANMSVVSTNGSSVPVTYSASTSGGVAPITVTGTPASGSYFPVGTTTVQVVAKSSDGQTASCSFTVTVTSSSSSSSTVVYGPQSTITCPSGAVDMWPGTNIQTMVDMYAGGTTFCMRKGTYALTSAITPKSGDTFVGEYGAILDGTGWATTDANQGAFRAHNQDIDHVTIRNLVIRNMPQRGIHAYYWMSDYWTIEYNEITANQIGLVVPNNSLIRNNYIHHSKSGGYLVWKSVNTVFENNQISYNGAPQKVLGATNVTFRGNFVHHNATDGIWYDTDNTGVLIEGNRVEDNGREGISHEYGGKAVIRNNAVRRNAVSGIFISTSKDSEIYGNTLEDNFRGIQYFLNCGAVGSGAIGADLTNNNAHDNSVKVGTQSGAFANALGYLSTCTSTQVAPYLNGSKNLRYVNNSYRVPSLSTQWWQWGFQGWKYWTEWQALGQDVTGTVIQ